MAGKMTAASFEARYGAIARQEFPHCTTVYMLRKALAKRRPPVYVTDAMLKVWFQNFSRPPNAVVVSYTWPPLARRPLSPEDWYGCHVHVSLGQRERINEWFLEVDSPVLFARL